MSDEADPNLTTFQDDVPPIDPIFDYPENMKTGHTPIVIDNGKSTFTILMESCDTRLLVFVIW